MTRPAALWKVLARRERANIVLAVTTVAVAPWLGLPDWAIILIAGLAYWVIDETFRSSMWRHAYLHERTLAENLRRNRIKAWLS